MLSRKHETILKNISILIDKQGDECTHYFSFIKINSYLFYLFQKYFLVPQIAHLCSYLSFD